MPVGFSSCTVSTDWSLIPRQRVAEINLNLARDRQLLYKPTELPVAYIVTYVRTILTESKNVAYTCRPRLSAAVLQHLLLASNAWKLLCTQFVNYAYSTLWHCK